jgi:mycothiol synthase
MGARGGGYRGRVADIRDATLDDLDPVYELLQARSRAAFGVSEMARAHVAEAFARPNTDRVVAVAGVVVGYAQLSSDHAIVHAARDAAVGDALLAVLEQRARERGFASLEATVVPEDLPFHELVVRSGFAHTRDVLRMWRDLREPLPVAAWADGATVRAYEDGDAARVHDLLDSTYGAWDASYVPLPHDEWLAFMTGHAEFDPALWFLVERDGDLVACALHWKEHQQRGWVKDIVVRESERGRGFAKALLHHAFAVYAARGASRVGLKVDSTNPTGAPQLYERVGFETDRRYGIWVKEL